jgi:peptidoglycan/xylan/chitin deacetylase (PgdA/CDA1 family)
MQTMRLHGRITKPLATIADLLLAAALMAGCVGVPVGVKAFFQSPTPTTEPTFTPTLPTATPSPSATSEPTLTPTLTPSPTPTLTPTLDRNDPATWNWHEAGQPVNAPILLYHHVTPEYVDSDYYLTLDLFTQQMDWLVAEGYTSVTASQLVQALTQGGKLPDKPVLITFDDGFADVYQYAYPILQERGLVATWYLVASYLNGQDCVTTGQADELIASGWEIGSHSMTHADLQYTEDTNYEMAQAKALLMKALDAPIDTIAYPFGSVNEYVFEKTVKYGYTAGMGLGKRNLHDLTSLYYLSRLVITQDMTSTDIAGMISAGNSGGY